MKQHLTRKHFRLQSAVLWLAPGIALLALLALSVPAAAQDSDEDWRSNLTCPAEHQVRKGVLYCTATYGQAKTMYVIVADLEDPDLRFEYVLPVGASDRDTAVEECQDVNRPDYGGLTGKGCYVPGNRNQYPRITLSEAVSRAKDVAQAADVGVPLVAVIDADYGSPSGNHGPEGLTIVHGRRLDGAANCDDDFNAVVRPWLALGETADPSTGRIPALISQLTADSEPMPIQTRTAFGGGPWLVRDGMINPDADSCEAGGGAVLKNPEKVSNCHSTQKATPGSVTESYGNSCYSTAHTAAGLSRDGRWLFLVITSIETKPSALADFLLHQLSVSNALKFDGGGSSQLWFNGASPETIHVTGEDRALSNWLAVYAADGDGIRLPLQAKTGERVLYKLIRAGETAAFKLEFENSGPLTWMPEDGVALRGPGMLSFLTPFKAGSNGLPLPGVVAPGGTMSWDWQEQSGGLKFARFQMARKGQAFGPDVQIIVVTIPKEMEAQQEKLQQQLAKIVEDWKKSGEEELDKLVERVMLWSVTMGKNLLQKALEAALLALQKAAQQSCGAVGLILLPLALVLWRRHSACL